MSKEFKHKIRVYYEDTDSGGVVYYANYLKFLERARSEAIYSIGLSNRKLLNQYETLIIVKSCNIKYKKPAKLEDELDIITKVKNFTRTSFTMLQKIMKNNEEISIAEIQLVTVNKRGKPVKIPEKLKNSL